MVERMNVCLRQESLSLAGTLIYCFSVVAVVVVGSVFSVGDIYSCNSA